MIWSFFSKFTAIFWWLPDKVSIDKIIKSPNYKKWKFINLVPTQVMTKNENSNFPLFSLLFPPKHKNPSKEILNLKLDNKNIINNSFSWLWHSTILMKIDNKNIIIDPVFNRASPIFLWWKPFKYKNEINLNDLPGINIVLISHDHYDHLDYKTIKELWNNVEKYIVPLWVKAHLQKWWIIDEKIEEIDWYESESINWINFTLTPSRHFSGRNFNNRFSTLWWGWIIKWEDLNIYFSWDSWYFDEFKKIWEKYWPFDLAFIENWAYNKSWSQIHMTPEESVQAGIDLKAKLLFPIHWGKFDLSSHNWNEPIKRFSKEAKNKNIPIVTPAIWDIFSKSNFNNLEWWE
jgi:L-ascorbate metabolism protein UlaG (beta-lactamase superfamily)